MTDNTTSPATDADIAEYKRLADAATAGPWVQGETYHVDFVRQEHWEPCGNPDHDNCAIAQTIHDVAVVGIGHLTSYRAKRDAAFITASRTAVPALIARISADAERINRLEAAMRDIRDNQGKVCILYEICECVSCASSYASWAIADASMRPEPETKP